MASTSHGAPQAIPSETVIVGVARALSPNAGVWTSSTREYSVIPSVWTPSTHQDSSIAGRVTPVHAGA